MNKQNETSKKSPTNTTEKGRSSETTTSKKTSAGARGEAKQQTGRDSYRESGRE